MMTDAGNKNLYAFDSLAGGKTGAIALPGTQTIEYDPVNRRSAAFTSAMDVSFVGAVVTFSGMPIYPTSGNTGLWIMVEYLPSVSVT